MTTTSNVGGTALANAIINSVEGTDWPDRAEYLVTYRTQCWPCQMGERLNKHFNTEDALNDWLAEQADWARLDGNSIEFTIYHWDLGPQYLRSGYY
jgi:hypothetical protein